MCSLLAMYGGTFDPIHYGHLKPIEILTNLIHLERIIIIPNKISPYRSQPKATSEQRRHMLKLAIANNPLFILDERELHRDIPSYTWQVLKEWRTEIGSERPLAFIIGQDSLLNLYRWNRYETILDKAHLIVCGRPGYPLIIKEEHHKRWLDIHRTYSVDDLHSFATGKIYLAETPWFDISATLIRQRLQNNLSCENLLPDKVLEYIQQQRLYISTC